MNNNKKDKVKDFFRKEGFYLVLFLCLCVIATVAVVTTRRNKSLEESNKAQNEFTLNVDDKETSEVKKQNAERVEGNGDGELTQDEEDIASNEEGVDVSSGTNTQVVFSNPIEGVISRGYTYPKPQAMSDGTSRNIRGINISAALGTEVMAAAVGEVKEISTKVDDGNYIVIAHPNGLYTKYTNLSNDIRVNVGDRVTEETVIGTVGSSSKIFTNTEFGEHLNIQVQDSDGKDLDPTTYFTFNEE
ncbi:MULTISPECIES: M23 family metallopeptidase [unclassified Clostridium]|uniref:M23 family metallopeptidase n=1 Tax=unclassified Clostridium TaxID=2614128 RepID=UPI00290D9D0B|nr:M23 family metallopeptidase [Clostridium sp.]MDU5108152.1 M23 family metallopeptidase [Clostridium sp.]